MTKALFEQWQEHQLLEGVVIVEGPVAQLGALGAMQSIYLREPDGHLV